MPPSSSVAAAALTAHAAQRCRCLHVPFFLVSFSVFVLLLLLPLLLSPSRSLLLPFFSLFSPNLSPPPPLPLPPPPPLLPLRLPSSPSFHWPTPPPPPHRASRLVPSAPALQELPKQARGEINVSGLPSLFSHWPSPRPGGNSAAPDRRDPKVCHFPSWAPSKSPADSCPLPVPPPPSCRLPPSHWPPTIQGCLNPTSPSPNPQASSRFALPPASASTISASPPRCIILQCQTSSSLPIHVYTIFSASISSLHPIRPNQEPPFLRPMASLAQLPHPIRPDASVQRSVPPSRPTNSSSCSLILRHPLGSALLHAPDEASDSAKAWPCPGRRGRGGRENEKENRLPTPPRLFPPHLSSFTWKS